MGTIFDGSRPMIAACGAGGPAGIDGAAPDDVDACEAAAAAAAAACCCCRAACVGTNAGGCFYAIANKNQQINDIYILHIAHTLDKNK